MKNITTILLLTCSIALAGPAKDPKAANDKRKATNDAKALAAVTAVKVQAVTTIIPTEVASISIAPPLKTWVRGVAIPREITLSSGANPGTLLDDSDGDGMLNGEEEAFDAPPERGGARLPLLGKIGDKFFVDFITPQDSKWAYAIEVLNGASWTTATPAQLQTISADGQSFRDIKDAADLSAALKGLVAFTPGEAQIASKTDGQLVRLVINKKL